MRPIPKPFRRSRALGLALALLLTAPLTPAAGSGGTSPPLEPLCMETDIFLGQAVPLRWEGVPIAQALREEFGGAPGQLEVFYVSETGVLPLKALGDYRPTASTDVKLSAVLHRESGRDQWKSFTYRVNVASGALSLRVEGEPPAPGAAALFRVEGQGLILYRLALAEADPQGGPPRLEAEFSGLPYGVYRATAMGSGQSLTARLGVCDSDDTISVARAHAVLRFHPVPESGKAAGECYRLRPEP